MYVYEKDKTMIKIFAHIYLTKAGMKMNSE